MRGIGSWLTRRELLTPDKEAIVDGARRLSYRGLNRRVNRLARAWLSLGLKSGQRLGILSYNRLEYVETVMAAAKLGVMVVPLNWRLAAQELKFILDDSGAQFLVFDPELAALAESLFQDTPVQKALVIGDREVLQAPAYEVLLSQQSEAEPEPDTPPDQDTPHIIMYTAGTTGSPKGAVLSQGASFWNAVNLDLALDFTSQDRDLLVLPMFHIGGLGLFTLPMLYLGGTVIIQRVFDPAVTLRLLEEERVSLFFGVPAVFLMLSQHPDFSGRAFESARLVMSGGAPLPVSLVRRYHEAGIILQQGFGMSEAAPSIATLPKELALEKAGSIGRAVFHLDVAVVDEAGLEVPRGRVGELVMRGPNLMRGYWNRPEATAEAFKDGWFHSGDLARMDEDGDLYIVDRKKDMFISGGENVYPAEIEQLIFQLPQVAEAAVVGVKDEKWGEVGRAVLVLKPGQTLSARELLDFLRPKLARYKVPKEVVFQEALPRNAAGKVLKIRLRDK
ncbi:MAG: long-chain fatty acid--CoA ligase [Thermodesulfobacteriota bacterium]